MVNFTDSDVKELVRERYGQLRAVRNHLLRRWRSYHEESAL